MVSVWRIVGYENRATSDESFTEARKEFAEIPAGAATTVFFELQLTDAGRRDTSRLGEVEIRWVTPATGESNRQHATLLSASEASENARDEAFLRFGGIVALAADRYSNLDYSESPVDRDLAILLEELWSLGSAIGRSEFVQGLQLLAGIPDTDCPERRGPPQATAARIV